MSYMLFPRVKAITFLKTPLEAISRSRVSFYFPLVLTLNYGESVSITVTRVSVLESKIMP